METIELSAAMAAVLKDNANPASLIGLNGADLTKSTMAQVSSVVGGLNMYGNISDVTANSVVRLGYKDHSAYIVRIISSGNSGIFALNFGWSSPRIALICGSININTITFYHDLLKKEGAVYVKFADNGRITCLAGKKRMNFKVETVDVTTLTKINVS